MPAAQDVLIHDKWFSELISQRDIEDHIELMGSRIRQDYQGSDAYLVGVLTGTFMFFSDLVKAAQLNAPISFIKISSYSGLNSTGKVDFQLGFPSDLQGRDVLVVDDILDTGTSYKALHQEIEQFKPNSVKLATLLYKPEANVTDFKPDYCGFEIENKFVVGYGLDYNHLGRHLTSIYSLKE